MVSFDVNIGAHSHWWGWTWGLLAHPFSLFYLSSFSGYLPASPLLFLHFSFLPSSPLLFLFSSHLLISLSFPISPFSLLPSYNFSLFTLVSIPPLFLFLSPFLSYSPSLLLLSRPTSRALPILSGPTQYESITFVWHVVDWG
jgi:hypothetical protein